MEKADETILPACETLEILLFYSISFARDRRLVTLILAYAKAFVLLCHAAYKYIGATFGASPSQLGSIMLTRALVQALTSPIGGLLGDRMDRTYLVAFGCILWGAMTAGIGLSQNLTQVSPWATARCLQNFLAVPILKLRRDRGSCCYSCKHSAALEHSTMVVLRLVIKRVHGTSCSSPLLTQAMCLSAWNGLGLALIIPCVESILADLYCATLRGRVFGFLFLASNFGE